MPGASRSSRFVIPAVLLSFAAVGLAAATPGSPMAAPALPGAGPSGPLTALVRGLGLDTLTPEALGLFGWAALIAATIVFSLALSRAWSGSVSVRAVVVVAVLLHVLVLLVPLLLSRDAYSYALYGRLVSEYDLNPYVARPLDVPGDPFLPVASSEWVGTSSLYGPVFVRLAAAVTSVAGSPAAEVAAFRVLAAVASMAAMLLVMAAARRGGSDRVAFAAMMIGWNPVVLFHAVGGAHNDALVAAIVAGAVLLLQRRLDVAATVALTIAALIKAPAAVLLVVGIVAIVLRRPSRQRLGTFALHAGAAAAVALIVAVPFLQAENPTLGLARLAAVQGWAAPARLLARIGATVGPSLATGAKVVVAAALPWGMVMLFRRWSADRDASTPTLLGWAALLTLLTAPLLNPWYVLLLVPLAWTLPDVGRRSAIAVCVLLSATMAVAERGVAPSLWDATVPIVHYGVAPTLLLILVLVLLRLKRGLTEAEGRALRSAPSESKDVPGRSEGGDDGDAGPRGERQAEHVRGDAPDDRGGQPH